MLETCRKRPDTSIQPLRKSYQVAVMVHTTENIPNCMNSMARNLRTPTTATW
jgi:hypothetical protein